MILVFTITSGPFIAKRLKFRYYTSVPFSPLLIVHICLYLCIIFVYSFYYPGEEITLICGVDYVPSNDTIMLWWTDSDPGKREAKPKPQINETELYIIEYLHKDWIIRSPIRTKEVFETFYCQAKNSHGLGWEASRRVGVFQGFGLTKVLQPSNRFILGGWLALRCEAVSELDAHARWLKDGKLLEESERNEMTVRMYQDDPKLAEYKLVIGNVTREDAGNYTCQIGNGVANVSSNGTVVIEHAPIITKERRDRTSIIPELVCQAIADPRPKFTWSHAGRVIAVTYNSWDRGNHTYEHYIVLGHKGVPGSGNFTCTVSNRLGSATLNFTVPSRRWAKRKPEIPTNLRTINITSNMIRVTWDPGFDGGAQAHYILRVKRFAYSDDPFEATINDVKGGICKTHVCKITGLKQNTAYRISVKAVNEIGHSEYSLPIHVVTTKAMKYDIPVPSNVYYVTPWKTIYHDKPQYSMPLVTNVRLTLTSYTSVEYYFEQEEIASGQAHMRERFIFMGVKHCLKADREICGPGAENWKRTKEKLGQTIYIPTSYILTYSLGSLGLALILILGLWIWRRQKRQPDDLNETRSENQETLQRHLGSNGSFNASPHQNRNCSNFSEMTRPVTLTQAYLDTLQRRLEAPNDNNSRTLRRIPSANSNQTRTKRFWWAFGNNWLRQCKLATQPQSVKNKMATTHSKLFFEQLKPTQLQSESK